VDGPEVGCCYTKRMAIGDVPIAQ